MNKKEKKLALAAIDERLAEIYPDAECALKYGGDPWRLLVMARLSAQCTDARVNEVSVELFREFPDAESMAQGDISRIEELVRVRRSDGRIIRELRFVGFCRNLVRSVYFLP